MFWGKAALLLEKRRGLGSVGKGRSGEMSWRTHRRGVTPGKSGMMDYQELSRDPGELCMKRFLGCTPPEQTFPGGSSIPTHPCSSRRGIPGTPHPGNGLGLGMCRGRRCCRSSFSLFGELILVPKSSPALLWLLSPRLVLEHCWHRELQEDEFPRFRITIFMGSDF